MITKPAPKAAQTTVLSLSSTQRLALAIHLPFIALAMSNTRIHHALPAPVVHAGFSVSQSKSTVLAGVRDAYWSEEEDVSRQRFSIFVLADVHLYAG